MKPNCPTGNRGLAPTAPCRRLVRRLVKKSGSPLFDGVVVDSWYAKGPLLKPAVEELGWPIVAVLKQERYEADQEALALTDGQKPTQVVERDGRRVEIWDVPGVGFTDAYPGPVRVIRVREQWTERKRVCQEWKQEQKEPNWIWLLLRDCDAYEHT